MLSNQLKMFALFGVLIVMTMLMSACAPSSRSGNVYSRDQARVSHSVYYGTILRVEEVTIEGDSSGAGTLA
ncbi:MAG: hypothetical protein GWN30_14235, partial [Gammaproteobacteria bacterium]|nr:hypothetical protein [Gammaproteobacteria bacterium]NIX00613.1 hypothetical protein [Phycisphaerae bacterium]